VLFRALREAWEGNFGESHRLLSRCRNRLHFEVERLQYSALFALALEMDNKRDASVAAISEIWQSLTQSQGDGVFERRQHAIGLLYGAIVRSLHGRFAHAESALARLAKNDSVTLAVYQVGQRFVDCARRHFTGTVYTAELETLASSGYAEVVTILRTIADSLTARRKDDRQRLSPSERTVLRLLNEGLATKQIAARTGRSVFTIRAHVANAIGKLGCHGRAEALAEARRLGVIP
jgi:DNA-binding CsgD family transcriptional regulator